MKEVIAYLESVKTDKLPSLWYKEQTGFIAVGFPTGETGVGEGNRRIIRVDTHTPADTLTALIKALDEVPAEPKAGEAEVNAADEEVEAPAVETHEDETGSDV